MDEGEENIVIVGDLNRRMGNHNRGMEEITGREGKITKHINAEWIIKLCEENERMITNTKIYTSI